MWSKFSAPPVTTSASEPVSTANGGGVVRNSSLSVYTLSTNTNASTSTATSTKSQDATKSCLLMIEKSIAILCNALIRFTKSQRIPKTKALKEKQAEGLLFLLQKIALTIST